MQARTKDTRLMHEIMAQPRSLERTMSGQRIQIKEFTGLLAKFDAPKIEIIGAGSSLNAALIASLCMKSANVRVCEPSSYSSSKNSKFAIFISQSGESADVLAALEQANKDGLITVALTNTPDSWLSKNAHMQIFTFAENEKCVPATGTMTSALITLLHIEAAISKNSVFMHELKELPESMGLFLDGSVQEDSLKISEEVKDTAYAVFLGQGIFRHVASEIALKVSETAYMITSYESPAMFRHGRLAPLLASASPISQLKKAAFILASINDMEIIGKYSGLAYAGGFAQYALFYDNSNISPGIRLGARTQLEKIMFPILFGQLLAHDLAEAKGMEPGISSSSLPKIVR